MSRFVHLHIAYDWSGQSVRTNVQVTLNIDAILWIDWSESGSTKGNAQVFLPNGTRWEIDPAEQKKLRDTLNDNQALWHR